MTEEEAQAWLVEALGVSRETHAQLDAFRQLVIDENGRQNLVSAASIPHFWTRHIVDSAQLLPLAEGASGEWLDLGTGAGFPGIVIAILRREPITLVESRKRRADFLQDAADSLGLDHVHIAASRLELIKPVPVSVISARAFAPLPKLFALAHSFSTEKTQWLLPKGRSAAQEVESVRGVWRGLFHVKQSVTDPESAILVASGVRRAGKA